MKMSPSARPRTGAGTLFLFLFLCFFFLWGSCCSDETDDTKDGDRRFDLFSGDFRFDDVASRVMLLFFPAQVLALTVRRASRGLRSDAKCRDAMLCIQHVFADGLHCLGIHELSKPKRAFVW